MVNTEDYLAGAMVQMLRKSNDGKYMNMTREYERLSSWHKKVDQSEFDYENIDGHPFLVLHNLKKT